MVPVTLGHGLINVNDDVGRILDSKWIDKFISANAIDKSLLINILPQGMFSVAVATVLFPTLARFATRGDLNGFRDTISRGVRQINFLLIPAAVVSVVLAEPIVRLLYERGAFEPDQTRVVAGALAAFSIGLTFNGMMLMLNRGFFSLQEPWIPTVVALANLVLNVVFYAIFYRVGVWGIPFAISLANIAGVAMLLFALRRRIGRLELTSTVRSFVLVSIASAALAAVSYGVWRVLDDAVGRSFAAQLLSLGAALALGGIVYVVACKALRVREIEALLSLRSRFRRA
jgi:putative peptidoglycan lipid II flippase